MSGIADSCIGNCIPIILPISLILQAHEIHHSPTAHTIAKTTEQRPRKISTARQPPKSGDSTVALNREPSIAPVANPSDMTPAAKPSCREENHSRFSLTKFIGNIGCTMPNKNENRNRDQKSTARPRNAPLAPAARHSNTNALTIARITQR